MVESLVSMSSSSDDVTFSFNTMMPRSLRINLKIANKNKLFYQQKKKKNPSTFKFNKILIDYVTPKPCISLCDVQTSCHILFLSKKTARKQFLQTVMIYLFQAENFLVKTSGNDVDFLSFEQIKQGRRF